MLKANTSKVSDSYAEVNHNLDELPCLVVVRMKMYHGDGTIMADGVGSSMQVFADVPDRTNAYLVYGYSNTTFRLWVDSSIYGAIFDGRKHTWFDMVISEGEAEIFAWKCSTITPLYNQRVVTKYNLGKVPTRWDVDVEYELETSLIRVSVLAEEPGGANEGFRFPGAMHLGYPAPSEAGNTIKYATVGGLSYTYETKYNKFNFWQPKYFDNESTIFIAESFGYGTNSEISHSESVYIQSWIYEENGGCPTPVISNGFADTSINGTSTGAQARVSCYERFMLIPKKDYYIHDYEQNTITCHKFGSWGNVPSCVPNDKGVDAECNPAVDKCRDKHAVCTLMSTLNVYKCACNGGYNNVNGRCKAQGKYLPKADYDSDWVPIRKGGHNWYLELEHGLRTVPMLVDVQVEVSGYVFHAIGFSPDQGEYSDQNSAVVYIYDESFINVSSFRTRNTWNANLMSRSNYMWDGLQYHWKDYGMVRAQAWKSESLPVPDLLDDSRVLRAKSSTDSDSFYELKHNLGEYPSLVVVRAKMQHNGSTFYADGVGSALNVFYNVPGMTNAFLVYGFSGESVRAWVDSSENGAIFDGRKHTKFDIIVTEAIVEIYAWKISTLTPFFTYMFSLDDDRFPDSVEF
ncbi:uncharacterized protein LOC128547456 isoform X2 [Mercenaria mercenaria]|nr:uncharacterized protein LOC128547456 isoform X2 [Mercenaria mercenaria]